MSGIQITRQELTTAVIPEAARGRALELWFQE